MIRPIGVLPPHVRLKVPSSSEVHEKASARCFCLWISLQDSSCTVYTLGQGMAQVG